MTVKRSRADKVRDGHKAHECRIAQYGPDEQIRAAEQAVWSKRHPDRAKADNPHLREKVISPSDLQRAKLFAAWHKANPTRSHSENPHSWSNPRLHSARSTQP